MRLDDLRQPEGRTAYDRPEGGTNITPGDRSPKGEGPRGKRHLCFGRPEGGTTYGSLKSSAYHRISHVDRHYQWVTDYAGARWPEVGRQEFLVAWECSRHKAGKPWWNVPPFAPFQGGAARQEPAVSPKAWRVWT